MKNTLVIIFTILVAVITLNACDASVRHASVHIAEVLLPPPPLGTIYIAINENGYEQFAEYFITNGIALPPGGPYTNITIDNITWNTSNNDHSDSFRDFWLLAAEDNNLNNKFDMGDRYVPFARITLTNGETLEITTVDFTNPMPFNPNEQIHTIAILHSNPGAIDKSHKVFFKYESTSTLFVISDPILCKEVVYWGNFSNYQLFWDKDGSINLSSGDYVTDFYAGDVPLYASFVLSPLQTY